MTTNRTCLLTATWLLVAASWTFGDDADSKSPKFRKITFSNEFYGEGATVGDFNKDGKLDYAAGPFWYEGPDFKLHFLVHRRRLLRLFNLAIGRHDLAQGTNPCVGVPMAKVGRKRVAYCPASQFESIYGRAPTLLWRALLVVFYTAGLRKREALRLTWTDIDFAAGEVHVTRKEARGFVQKWSPKDHELRTIPLPPQAIDLLTKLQAEATEQCPYVFMERDRWDYYRRQIEAGEWTQGRDLTNNCCVGSRRCAGRRGSGRTRSTTFAGPASQTGHANCLST